PQRGARNLHVLPVTAVTTGAVDHRALEAHLRPARPAVLAVAAAVVVVVHHTLAHPGFLISDAGAHGGDEAARLVAGDYTGLPLDAPGDGPRRLGPRAIVVAIDRCRTCLRP